MHSRLGSLNRCALLAMLLAALFCGWACAQEASPVYSEEELILLPAVDEPQPAGDEAGLAEEIAALKERIEEDIIHRSNLHRISHGHNCARLYISRPHMSAFPPIALRGCRLSDVGVSVAHDFSEASVLSSPSSCR